MTEAVCWESFTSASSRVAATDSRPRPPVSAISTKPTAARTRVASVTAAATVPTRRPTVHRICRTSAPGPLRDRTVLFGTARARLRQSARRARPGGGARPRGADVGAVVLRAAGEAGRVALADRAELPLRTVAVQLAEDQCRLRRVVLAQVVAGELVVVGRVDHPDEGVGDLAERLAAGVGVVDRHREDDLVDVGGHAG